MPPIPEDRATRIEQKVDELKEAVSRLILIDERQMRQGERLGAVEERLGDVEKEQVRVKAALDKVVWFTAGACGVLTVLFAIGQFAAQFVLKGH